MTLRKHWFCLFCNRNGFLVDYLYKHGKAIMELQEATTEKVMDKKTKYKKIKLIISYWLVNLENEEHSKDFDIPLKQIYTRHLCERIY